MERNFTKELTLPTKRMKVQSIANITASIKLCAQGCKRCGKEKEFICYSTIPKSLRNGKTSNRKTVMILCALGCLFFFIIFGMILWLSIVKEVKVVILIMAKSHHDVMQNHLQGYWCKKMKIMLKKMI